MSKLGSVLISNVPKTNQCNKETR